MQTLVSNGVVRITIEHLSFQKVVLRLDEDQLLTFILRISNNEQIKVLMTPPIGSLNDYLAYKFQRTLKQLPQFDFDLARVSNIFRLYLNEVYFSYSAFRTILDLQYTCESLQHGPNLDNVSFAFEFMQTEFDNEEPLHKSTSLALQQKELRQSQIFKRELVLVVNYRRLFQVAFRVKKTPGKEV